MTFNIFNPTSYLQTAGYVGLFFMIYAETGLLVGLVLPGENLLFAVGLLSSQGYFNIWAVIPIVFIAAALADSTGYAFGKKYGRKVFARRGSLLFEQSYVGKSEKFFQRHGGKSIILARFVPFIRTLTPILAGIGQMKYKTFLIYNIIGALSWAIIISLSAYFLGKTIPNANHYILWLAVGAVVIFTLPSFITSLLTRQ